MNCHEVNTTLCDGEDDDDDDSAATTNNFQLLDENLSNSADKSTSRPRRLKVNTTNTTDDSASLDSLCNIRKKRLDLTLCDKVKVVHMHDKDKIPQSKVAKAFKVSQSQVSRILRNKEKLLQEYKRFINPDRKRNRLGKPAFLEHKLLDWYEESKDEIPINGPVLMEKARAISKSLGENFNPSVGWLGRWKERNGITFKNSKDKNGEASISKMANHWRRYSFPKATKDVQSDDIWIVDSFPLLYKDLPNSIYDGNSSNAKFLILLATNITASERKKPVVIGRHELSFSFLKLPVTYYYNSNYQITKDMLISWLRHWNCKLKLKNRKILLIMEKLSFSIDVNISNIDVHFFPSGCRNVIQPFKFGITRYFKSLYKFQLIRQYLVLNQTNHVSEQSVSKQDVLSSISVLDCLYMIVKAWYNLKCNVIIKGFVRVGLSKEVEALSSEENLPIPPGMSKTVFEDYISKDEDMDLKLLNKDCFTNDNSGNETISLQQNLPDLNEVVKACQILKSFIYQKNGNCFNEFTKIESVVQTDVLNAMQISDEAVIDPFDIESSINCQKESILKDSNNDKFIPSYENSTFPIHENTSIVSQELPKEATESTYNIHHHQFGIPSVYSINDRIYSRNDIVTNEIQPIHQPEYMKQDYSREEFCRPPAVEFKGFRVQEFNKSINFGISSLNKPIDFVEPQLSNHQAYHDGTYSQSLQNI